MPVRTGPRDAGCGARLRKRGGVRATTRSRPGATGKSRGSSDRLGERPASPDWFEVSALKIIPRVAVRAKASGIESASARPDAFNEA